MVNMIAEGIQQAINLKEQKEQHKEVVNMVKMEEKLLQQELAEMRATPQAMQQNNLQQRHTGLESQQYFYPAANAMIQQHLEKTISGKDSHNRNSIQIKDSSSNLLDPTPIQRSIAGLMEHAITGGQSVGIRQKDTKMQPPSRTKWEEAQRTEVDGVGRK
eukprot:4910418-Ditylum_brightwellii.AAC.1